MSCQHKYNNCKSVCKSPPLRDGYCTLHYKQILKQKKIIINEENNNIVYDKYTTDKATLSNQIIDITNNTLNENIFSDEQKAYIISKFPKKLHEYLNKINNPLDETQVIISILKERNIRIVLNYEENMFGICEWKGYYHATDIETELGCSTVDNWKRWNINFKKFNDFENKNLVHQIDGQENIRPIYNFNTNKININAQFIDDDGLKIVLIKTTKQSTEIDLFKDWIIKYSTIAKSVISMVIQIKQQYEYEQLKNKIDNNQIKCEQNEITYFYEINDITPYLQLNVIYFGDTGEVFAMDGKTYKIYKLGLSHRSIERDFREHKKSYVAFRMVHIKHCDNNIVVEQYLKMELKAKNLLYELPKKISVDDKKLLKYKKPIDDENNPPEDENKISKNTETFILTEKYDINYIIDLINRLVDEYPLRSIKERDDKIKELENNNILKEKELDLKMKEEETKQKEEETKQKQIEKEQKEIDKEIKLAEIQLEMMKLKYKNHQEYDKSVCMTNNIFDDHIHTLDAKDLPDNMDNISDCSGKLNNNDDNYSDNDDSDSNPDENDNNISHLNNDDGDGNQNENDNNISHLDNDDGDGNEDENDNNISHLNQKNKSFLNNFKFNDDLLVKTIDVDEIAPYENKIITKNLTVDDKYIIKRYYLKRLLKIKLTDDVIKTWHNKEKQLNNLLCAINKKSFDLNDPYFINMNNKINYLNKILDTFGFKNPLDFKSTITTDYKLLKKFEDSKIIETENYRKMMMTFNKRILSKDDRYDLKKFIKICNCILNEFCIVLCQNRMRRTEYGQKTCCYEYKLTENIKYLKQIIENYV